MHRCVLRFIVLSLILARASIEADNFIVDGKSRLVRKERAGIAQIEVLHPDHARLDLITEHANHRIGKVKNDNDIKAEERKARQQATEHSTNTKQEDNEVSDSTNTTRYVQPVPVGCPRLVIFTTGGSDFVDEYLLHPNETNAQCCFTIANYETAHAFASCDNEVAGWSMMNTTGVDAVSPHSCCMPACPDGQFQINGKCCPSENEVGCVTMYKANSDAGRCGIFGMGEPITAWAPRCPPPNTTNVLWR